MDTAKLRGQSFGLLIMLAVQFALGMALNLFVKLPKAHPGQTGGYFARTVHGFGWAITNGGGIVLILHVIVAIGLLLASLALLARAIASQSRSWTVAGLIGFLGIVAALTNGLAFIGYNSDITSYVMAMGFIVAAVSYSAALSFAAVPAKAAKPAGQKASPAFRGHHYRPRHT